MSDMKRISRRYRLARTGAPRAAAGRLRLAAFLIVLVTSVGTAGAAPVTAPKAANPTATPPTDTGQPKRDVKSAQPAAGKEAIRTLEAIHIEGEIPVPQVLFITARDLRRFRDGLGHTYQIGALDVARSVSLPDRLRVAAQPEKH
jgi:hypothetical protein